MKKLLSDEVVQLILNNIEGIGYCDILDMLDDNEIKIKLYENEMHKLGFFSLDKFNKNKYSIMVKDTEILIDFELESLGKEFTDNKHYIRELNNQYNKFKNKLYIKADEITSKIDNGEKVYFDIEKGITLSITDKNEKFTVEELSKFKFYVID